MTTAACSLNPRTSSLFSTSWFESTYVSKAAISANISTPNLVFIPCYTQSAEEDSLVEGVLFDDALKGWRRKSYILAHPFQELFLLLEPCAVAVQFAQGIFHLSSVSEPSTREATYKRRLHEDFVVRGIDAENAPKCEGGPQRPNHRRQTQHQLPVPSILGFMAINREL